MTTPATAPQQQKFNVLIIEDDTELFQNLSVLLNRLAECRHTSTGAQGLAAFQESAPDLVMLSVNVPDMDSYQICTQIRQNSTVPILMMSKTWNDKEELNGLKAGADGFVHEPYNSQLMVANVVAQLRRAYKYDHQEKPSEAATQEEQTDDNVPAGWAVCESCGYMGPQQKFEKENIMGEMKRACPHCGEESSATYSIG